MATAVSVPPDLNRPLSGLWLRAARGAWLVVAVLATVVLAVGLADIYAANSRLCSRLDSVANCDLLGVLRLRVLAESGLALYTVGAASLMAVSWTLMGWLVFLRSPASAASLLMSLGLVTGWATDLTGQDMNYGFFAVALRPSALTPLWLVCGYVVVAVSQITVVAMMLLLPDGHFRPRWTAPLLALWSVHVLVNTLYHGPFYWFKNSYFAEVLDETFVLAMPVAVVVAVWLKYRAAGEATQAQLRALWPSARAFIVVYALFAGWMLLIYPPGSTDKTPLQYATDIAQVGVQSAIGAWFGLALGTAILRHNLLKTDLFVSRALVYTSLSGALLLLYLGVVFGVGGLLGFSGTPWFPLVATGLILALFEPLRTLLARRVERTLYGVREPPFRAFAGVARRLDFASSDPFADPFADVVTTIARWFNLPFVRLSVATSAFTTETRVGTLRGEAVRFPVVSQGRQLGLLEVAVPPGEVLTAEERDVLGTVAGQLAASLRSLEGAAELQGVRERLVIAREEERRRLQRDLHDRLGPALAAGALTAGSARGLAQTDPDGAERLLGRLEEDLYGTLGELRRLVYRLAPTDLGQLGLYEALRLRLSALAGDALALELRFPDPPPALPVAAESAAYHIACEAVTNAVRHARARRCRVELAVQGGRLELSVRDDGCGFSEARRGVGLPSMQERAEELGGRFTLSTGAAGTAVGASLPLVGPPEARG